MDYSDRENDSDVGSTDDILGPEDLFNDEADEDGEGNVDDKIEGKPNSQEDMVEKVEKKVKQRRIVRNPRITLNVESLKGKNGLSALKKLFSNFKFKGNGHEKEDLSKIMAILQQWMCYQLCPSYNFESCMLQLEALGKKKVVQTLMKKYRLGMDEWGENREDEEDNAEVDVAMEKNQIASLNDDFDVLMAEEITNADIEADLEREDVTLIENSEPEPEIILTQEQIERIERNRKLAQERRLKRLSAHCEQMEVTEQPDKICDQDISVGRITLEDSS